MEKLDDSSVSIKLSKKFIDFIKNNSDDILNSENITENVEKTVKQIQCGEEPEVLNVFDVDWFRKYIRRKNGMSVCDDFVEGSAQEDVPMVEGYSSNDALYEAILLNKDKLLSDGDLSPLATQQIWLHELLDGCTVLLPVNKETQRSPELENRIARLKREQEEKEYKEMTRNVNMAKKFIPEDTVAFQMRMMNRHLIGVAQFIISVLAGFAFGFIGIQFMVGELDFGFRLLLGIMFGLIIALAEIYFLAKHLAEEFEELPSDKVRLDLRAPKSSVIATKPHQD